MDVKSFFSANFYQGNIYILRVDLFVCLLPIILTSSHMQDPNSLVQHLTPELLFELLKLVSILHFIVGKLHWGGELVFCIKRVDLSICNNN